MKKSQTEEQEIIKRLDLLIRLGAASVLREMTIEDKVRFLAKSGLEANDIAMVLGKSTGHVRKSLSTMRKESKQRASRRTRRSRSDQE